MRSPLILCLLLFCLLVPAELPAQQISSFPVEKTADELFASGSALAGDGRYAEAIPYLEEAGRRRPNFHQAQYQLGLCYLKTGRYDQARQVLTSVKVLAAEPTLKKAAADLIDSIQAEIENEKRREEEGRRSQEAAEYARAQARRRQAETAAGRQRLQEEARAEEAAREQLRALETRRPAAAAAPDRKPREIYANAKDAVVYLTVQRSGFPPILGTGFFISPNLVVTNLHVVYGAEPGRITVLGGNRQFSVRDIYLDSSGIDIAVLTTIENSNYFLPLESAANPEIGEEVYTIGNPIGFPLTFSNGLVSGIRNQEQYIQTTAPVSQGSSGGPLINQQGRVIGIITGTFQGTQNLNFAVPVKFIPARFRLEAVRAGEQRSSRP
ncbi:MAG TPA: trypsin-like peptidase domain-containing protein [bacterium]|uniref:Putative serine protease HtrA n=1 Tax=candidate division TA06 bacterium ADurb.Bin417 TaxID=1852828 RepID=A0A1V5MKH5_UNCT6|nr:MAG: putative serine protease HtrA [candidate division TA06 bacterium ADurb.Bin417]HNQ34996.1 trypsin-like peptidase domain-containing protein [bacterium]HNS49249.1 trypsin-like peptidase domain-containing protein [bacterium]